MTGDDGERGTDIRELWRAREVLREENEYAGSERKTVGWVRHDTSGRLAAEMNIPDATERAALCLRPRVLVARPAPRACCQSVRNMLRGMEAEWHLL